MKKTSNVTTRELRKVLKHLDYSLIGIKGGHEKWGRKGALRPVIFQTHIEPIPEFIVMNCIRNMGISKKQFLEILERI